MVEFNPDGSLKLPENMVRQKNEDSEKLKKQRCIKVCKEVVSFTAPKKCILRITLSDFFHDDKFIWTIYGQFKQNATVPHTLRKVNEREFEVEIGTDFRRCTDCNSLVNQYRDFLDGNIIEEKRGCTFEGRKKNFCYEDHFD